MQTQTHTQTHTHTHTGTHKHSEQSVTLWVRKRMTEAEYMLPRLKFTGGVRARETPQKLGGYLAINDREGG